MRFVFVVLAILVSSCASRSVLDHTVEKAISTPWQEAGYRWQKGDNLAPVLEKMRVSARVLGINILDEDPSSVTNAGEAWQDENGHWSIVLNNMLDVNGRTEVLIHEIAHTFEPPNLDKSEEEMFADLVSVAVLAKFDYDTSNTSAHYLAQYKSGLLAFALYRKDIEAATIAIYEASQH